MIRNLGVFLVLGRVVRHRSEAGTGAGCCRNTSRHLKNTGGRPPQQFPKPLQHRRPEAAARSWADDVGGLHPQGARFVSNESCDHTAAKGLEQDDQREGLSTAGRPAPPVTAEECAMDGCRRHDEGLRPRLPSAAKNCSPRAATGNPHWDSSASSKGLVNEGGLTLYVDCFCRKAPHAD